MPPQSNHEEQAKHNREMLDFVNANDCDDHFRDWYVTVSYYTALHYFEAILPVVVPRINFRRKIAPFEQHYYDHGERLIAMADPVFVDIHRPYKPLYNISRAAKYNEHDVSIYSKVMINGYLAAVENKCNTVKGHYP
jgi:hypothetical protein